MISNYTLIDELGLVLGQAAELKKKADAIKAKLRKKGAGTYEGQFFRATVGEDGTAIKRDAQAMRDKLWTEGYYAFVKAHEQEVFREGAIRVVAKTGEDAKLKKAA